MELQTCCLSEVRIKVSLSLCLSTSSVPIQLVKKGMLYRKKSDYSSGGLQATFSQELVQKMVHIYNAPPLIYIHVK